MEQNPNNTDTAEQRLRDAQAEVEIARLKAEKAAAEQQVKDQKAKNRKKKVSAFKKLSRATKIIVVLAIVAVVAAAIAIIPGILNSSRLGTTVSEAALKEAVSISKLSTAEFSYNGIAEKQDEEGNVSYYIYYEATAKAGIDMEQIGFDIDQDNKIITVTLPTVDVGNPVIDESKIEYLPSDADIVLSEVINTCREDVLSEIQNNPNIRNTAEENLKATLEALLMPIIGGEGYQLSWEISSDVESGDNDDIA